MKKINIEWKQFLIFTLIFLLAVILFSNQKKFDMLQFFTINISYWFGVILFLILIISLYIHKKEISKIFKISGKKTILLLLLIVILSVYLRVELSPMHHPFRTGGGEYKLTAKYLSIDHKYSSCLTGTFDNCERISIPEHGVIYSFMLSAVYDVFGFKSQLVTWFNILLSCITIILIFLTAQIFFKNQNISLFSALIFALLKRHIIFSGTDEITVAIVMFVALFFFSIALFWKTKSIKTLLLVFISLSLAINIFVINSVLIFILLIYLILKKEIKIENSKIKNKSYYGLMLLVFISSLPIIFYTLNNPFTAIYNTGGNTIFNFNIVNEISTFFSVNLYAFPTILLIFFLLGFLFWQKYKSQLFIILVSLVAFVGTHLIIFHQNYERYLVHYYPLISIIMGLGAYFTYSLLIKHVKSKNIVVGIFIIVLILVSSINFNNLFFEKNKLHLNDPAYQSKDFDDSNKLLESINNISDGCFLLVSNNLNRIVMAETNKCVISSSEFMTNPTKWNKIINDTNMTIYLTDDLIFKNTYRSQFIQYIKDNYIIEEIPETKNMDYVRFWKIKSSLEYFLKKQNNV